MAVLGRETHRLGFHEAPFGTGEHVIKRRARPQRNIAPLFGHRLPTTRHVAKKHEKELVFSKARHLKVIVMFRTLLRGLPGHIKS